MCTVAMQTMLSESYSVRLLQEASEARRQNMVSEACKRYKQMLYSNFYRLQTVFCFDIQVFVCFSAVWKPWTGSLSRF